MKKHGESSFIVYKKYLTEEQVNMILHYQEFVRELIEKGMLEGDHEVCGGTDFPMTPFGYLDDQWVVEDADNRLYGSTVLDNFDMEAYMKHVGINPDLVIWRDYA
jgi:hypothetical protein